MEELLTRLRACSIEFVENMPCGYGPAINPDGPEAAGCIEQLQARAEAAEARVKALEEALRPFAEAYIGKRELYANRYQNNRDTGYQFFDNMPDTWPLEKAVFTKGEFRRASEALKG